ncbi:MAG: aminotransferase class V-fold PLP-dependent enzyme [Planctomycetota bacterium]
MRVYLDNAATSFPKPTAVYDAVDAYQRKIGVAVGRGSYGEALEAQRIVDRCRQRAASLFGAESPSRMVFTYSGTDGLNLALLGLCRPGDHVVTSVLEHNSVLRPLRWLQERRGIDITFVAPRADGRIEPTDVRDCLRPETRLVAILHASNVTGAVQPMAEIGELARRNGSLVLVDAAQTAGHTTRDISRLPVDVIACPGHKGLLGPLGTGLVYLRPGLEDQLDCYRLGGTGTHSEDDHQPMQMPDRYESGNHNAPGLAGLEAGLAFLQSQTIEKIRSTEAELTGLLVEGLRSLPRVTVYGHASPQTPHVGVVSFNIEGFAPHEVASILDESFGVQARAGLHCAPGVHRWLGTLDGGGTVRFSVGRFTTAGEIDHALASVRELADSQ